MVPSNFDVDMKAVDSLPSETTPVLKDKDKDKDIKGTTIVHGQEEKNNGGPLIHTDATTNQETNGHTSDHDIDMTTTSGRQQKDEEPRISEEMYKRLKRKLKEAMEVRKEKKKKETGVASMHAHMYVFMEWKTHLRQPIPTF